MGLFSRNRSEEDRQLAEVTYLRRLNISGNAYGIDLGSCNIKLYSKSAGRISVAKNMIAIRGRDTTIACGDAAYEMYEKSPASITVSYPIISGVIADIFSMEEVLRATLKSMQKGSLRPADFVISVPTDVTEVERRAFYDLIKEAGVKAKNVVGVEKPIADALGLGIDVKNCQGALIVDVGYDTTEISVLSMGGIVLTKLLKTGGHVFDNAIVSAVRREFNLVIGNKTAEMARLALGQGKVPQISIYGRDVVTGLPTQKVLTQDFVLDALNEYITSIVEQVRVMLERTPPELSADIYRQGIFVTGGACQQEGFVECMQSTLNLNINVADSPVHTVALGLAQVINKPHYRSLAYMIEGLGK